MKNVLIVGAIILAVGLGAWYFELGSKKQQATTSVPEIKVESSDSQRKTAPDLIIGSPSAPVEIVEYADFKCPTCNKFTEKTYLELKTQYLDTGRAKIVFRNLPFIAEDSLVAAEGAYCANDQSKFVSYHDLLYRHIREEYYSKGLVAEGEAAAVFTPEVLAGLVESIGGDSAKFSACLEANTFSEAVTSDLTLSKNDGATGTPTFIIGGQKIVGAQPFGIFDKLIKAIGQ